MTITILDNLMACDDCLMLVVNSEPPDNRPDIELDIAVHLGLAPRQHLACGDSDNDIEFTWRACQCCGSTLGGRRNELVLFEV